MLFSVFILGLLIGVISTYVISNRKSEQELLSRQIRLGGYKFINPLLECEVGLSSQNTFSSLKLELEDIIHNLKSNGQVSDVSIYVRDLNNGPTMGMNDDEEFSPASLLKLPIMIAYFKVAEEDPDILKKKVKLEVDENYNNWESLKSPNYLEIGKEYTNEELIRAMIVSSDNNAMARLSLNLSSELQDRVYKELGVSIPGSEGLNDFMSVSQYASFYRILYNASYLEPYYSEKALTLLSEIDYDGGIRSGIPGNILIANKFGERQLNGVTQLHDCGIVYLKNKPILICIMTKGDSIPELSKSISEISRAIYKSVSIE